MTYAAFPSETDPPILVVIKAPSIWQDETICAYVRKLWEDHSASEISVVLGTELGITVKRNAVIGWLHRQKLTIEQKTKVHPLTSHTLAPRQRTKPPKRPKAQLRLKQQVAGEPFVMRCAEVEPRHLTLEQLAETTCHWPFGDVGVGNGVTFCGHPPLKGLPYCQPHQAIATKPARAQ